MPLALPAASSTATDQNLCPTSPKSLNHASTRLDELIQSLPRELFDQIQDDLYQMLFCPGFAFPHRQTGQGTFEWKAYVYKTPQTRYLTISKAPSRPATLSPTIKSMSQSATQIPNREIRSPIPSYLRHPHPTALRSSGSDLADLLHISNKRDLVGPAVEYLGRSIVTDTSYISEQRNVIEVLLGNHVQEDQEELPLKELTLGFRECYGGYNRWLGTNAATGMELVRRHIETRMPELRVIAPSEV
ncbi:MAG: hypothetical protein Q9168_003227 [Polycauliona sp. 1 TL-2023]